MPISPFDSVAPASAAEATHIQFRRAFAPVSARWAITSGAEGERQEEREPGVQGDDLGDAGVPECRGEYESRIRAERDAAQCVARGSDREDTEESGKRGPQARGPLVYAEGSKGGGRQPVLEGRLLEILEGVEAWRHPVARRGHLARDLGIATLVRMHEMPRREGGEPKHRQRDEQRPEGRGGRRPGERGGAEGGAVRSGIGKARPMGRDRASRRSEQGAAPCVRPNRDSTCARLAAPRAIRYDAWPMPNPLAALRQFHPHVAPVRASPRRRRGRALHLRADGLRLPAHRQLPYVSLRGLS